MSPPYFFLWSFLKDTANRNQPRTEGELKDTTETEIKAIEECLYKKMFKILLRQMDVSQTIYDV